MFWPCLTNVPDSGGVAAWPWTTVEFHWIDSSRQKIMKLTCLFVYRQTKMDGTLPETSDQCKQFFSFRVSTSMHQDWQMLNLASPDLIVSGQVDGSIYVGVKDSGAWRHPPWFPEGTMFIWDAEFIHQVAGLAVSILVTMEYVMNWESLSGLFHSLFSPSLSFALLSFALCIISIYSTFRFERSCILFILLHHFLLTQVEKQKRSKSIQNG